jgi:phosphoribosylaminoimidazole-succinocarboxamide synthase
MPSGLVESEKLAQPMFTPSTKAEQGEHDENIHPDRCTTKKYLGVNGSEGTHW